MVARGVGRWGHRPAYEMVDSCTSGTLQLVKSIVTVVAIVSLVSLVSLVAFVHAQNQIYLEIHAVMLRFVHGPGHLVPFSLKGVRTRIGQKKPGDLKMTNSRARLMHQLISMCWRCVRPA